MTENLEKAQFHIAKAIEQLNNIECCDDENMIGEILEVLWSADAMIDDALCEIDDEEDDEEEED